MISVEEAFEFIRQTVQPRPTEHVDLSRAIGLYLAESLASDVDSPPHDKSVMDGYAVRHSDIGQLESFEVVETIVAGSVPQHTVGPGQTARIMTGAPLPNGADAVVMIELSRELKDDPERIAFDLEQLAARQHVMEKASSLAKGQQIFPAGHQIRPTDVGLLAETGNVRVNAIPRPSVAILPTGDELVDCSEVPGPGQIRNSNGPMLEAMVRACGCPANYLGVGRDDKKDLEAKIASGLRNDVLILSGGVSAGMLDLVPAALKNQGVREVFHKVKIKPGKPIWFGVLERSNGNSTYVFGLPGNPVSSLVGFRLFVRYAIDCLMGATNKPKLLPAVLLAEHQTRGNRPTYWPGCWESGADSSVASKVERQVRPLAWQGSSDLRALGAADCLIHFPTGGMTYAAGEYVEVLTI